MFSFTLYHYDDLISVNSDLSLSSWKERRNEVLRKCRNDIEDSNATETKASRVFLIDDNMYLQSMRYSYFQLARFLTVGFCQIFIECPEQLLKQRLRERNKSKEFELMGISEETFSRMSIAFEPPKVQVNGWESNTVTVEPDKKIETTLAMVEGLFYHSMKYPVQPVPDREKIVCGVDSFHHRADLLLRTIIKARIEESDPKLRGNIAKSLTENKKLLLESLRKKSLADFYLCEHLDSVDQICRDKVMYALEVLDWPLDKWDPPDVCEQVVTECFVTLTGNSSS